MREPTIKIGFIIFNPYWREELEWNNGHRKTACEWIKNYNFMELFDSIKGQNNIYDEEDFLTDYIGAIKLYASRGQFYCYVPSIISPDKDYLKKFFKDLGYHIIENGIFDENMIQYNQKYNEQCDCGYNKTLIKTRGRYYYNPLKNGD